MTTKNIKSAKVPSFKEVLISQIESYMDLTLEVEDAAKREKYRSIIHKIEELLLIVTELE